MSIHIRLCQPKDPDLDFDYADFKAHEYTISDIHYRPIKSLA